MTGAGEGGRSTGPRTPEGKAASSKNALKYGMLSRSPVLADEDEQAFADFRSRWLATLRPEGEQEVFLSDRLVTLAWRLLRMERVEAGILAWRMQEEREVSAREKVQVQLRVLAPIDAEFMTIVDPAAHKAALEDLARVRASRRREDVLLGLAFMREATESEALGKLARYETTLERSFYRTVDQLRRLQDARRAAASEQPADRAKESQDRAG